MTNSEKFIEAWLTSDSIDEVAKRLRVSEQAVKVRAQAWRKRGVRLPKLASERKHGNRLDIDGLNKLIASKK